MKLFLSEKFSIFKKFFYGWESRMKMEGTLNKEEDYI